MILLDTDVVSNLRRPGLIHPALARWAATISFESAFLSTATIFEIERGLLLAEPKDPRKAAAIRRWLEEEVLVRYAGRILPVDVAIARRCATLHIPRTRPAYDALIAATALVHGLTVVTRNTRDFAPMGVAVLDPWNLA